MESYKEIYPQLPSISNDCHSGDNTHTGDNFRLKQCADYLLLLEKDLQEREKIYKKYKRARSYLLNLSTGSGTLSVIFSGGGLGTGLTGFGIPIAVALGVMGGVCALTSVGAGSLAKVISGKVSKHEKTVSVCQAKINTIKDIVSKALTDNKISHEEFVLIKSEYEKYHEMKRSIRKKTKDTPPPPPPPVDVKKMEEDIRAEILKRLTQSE